MQILTNVNFNFMRWKTHLVVVSTALNIFGLGLFAWKNASGTLNVGIDFKGGSEIRVKFAQPTSVGDVRSALDRAALTGTTVTTIGDPTENEIYIRLPLRAVESRALLANGTKALRGIRPRPSPPPVRSTSTSRTKRRPATSSSTRASSLRRRERRRPPPSP